MVLPHQQQHEGRGESDLASSPRRAASSRSASSVRLMRATDLRQHFLGAQQPGGIASSVWAIIPDATSPA